MNLQDARDAYYAASGTASAIVRQLALAGVAVVWLLAGGLQAGGKIHVGTELLWASALVLLALVLDLLQYVFTTVGFAVWAAKSEGRLDRAGVPPTATPGAQRVPTLARLLNYPPPPTPPQVPPTGNQREIGGSPDWLLGGVWVFFALKVLSVVAGYAVIGTAVVDRLSN